MKAVAGLAELRGQIVTVSDQIELAKVDTRRAELAAAAYETARKARDQAIREARVTISVAEDASRHAHETAAAAKTSGIKLLETECRRVTTLRDDAVSRAALISTVPCEGAEPYAGCRFLLDAIAGRDQAPAHAAAVADLESHLASAHSALAIPPDIEALTASIDRAKGAGAAAEAIELPPVPASHTDAAPALERAKKALEQQLGSAAKIEEEERRLNVVAARIEELTGALTAVDEDLAGRRAALHTIEQEVAGASLLDSSIRDGEEMVRRTRASLDAAARARADAEREIGRLQGELAAAEARRLLADTTRVTISAERTELEDWVLLERAWRPTGIPARRVGAALPEISGFSTDLLRECYGDSLFELSFEDQRDSADEKRLLEVLDVTVRRGGETVAVEVLSGGPSVIVNEAVSLGIALYQRARSGRHLGVIMRDEVSGKLDIERAPAYVRMLRRAAALAHFRHVLFVSHQPACLDIADARIEVSHGTLTIS